MSERIVSHELSESEIEIILKALDNYERFCKRTSINCMRNGYGTVTSISKSEAWTKKEEEVKQLQSKIANRML